MPSLIVFIVAVALLFDFINGFHDAANSIATVVSTRVLTPLQAVVWAAFFNFVAAFGFGVGVATTVGKGVVHADVVDQWVILAGLVGAIVWDVITWYWGLPTSSSHALIGGLAGAGVVKAGFGSLVPAGLVKIGVFMVLSPLIGFALGFLMMLATLWTFQSAHPGRVDRLFRRLQLLSAGAYSLGHGTNDAQKTMGMRITKLRPIGGFSAETAGALTLVGTAIGGIPVSTTHTISGSIMGVGSITRFSAVRWGVAGRIVTAWVFTIPAAALISAVAWFLLHLAGS